MKSPKDMRIIQIDITNACPHRCSNCTRFCGHYKKPFFMDFETFKRAVDSMDGFQGTIGVMGGEPTLHPEFERFARYIASKYPRYQNTDDQMLHPQKDFMKTIAELEISHTVFIDEGKGAKQALIGPGLWSAMGQSYKKHYEIIQDTFKYQALNDHENPMYHQPALVTRKELGVGDEEWLELRDKCWIQNEWSATITPKGAFFCEIAGALDMLFDGPGGWPIEPGWWRRLPYEFGDQLQWCEMCGMACHTFARNANEVMDDVSPVMAEKLQEIESPWLKDHVNILRIENGVVSKESKPDEARWFGGTMPYTENYEARFSSTKTTLYPSGFDGICLIHEYSILDTMAERIEYLAHNVFDKLSVVLDLSDVINSESKEQLKSIMDMGASVFDMGKDSLGKILHNILDDEKKDHYQVLFTSDIEISGEFRNAFDHVILNPGVLIRLGWGEYISEEIFGMHLCSSKEREGLNSGVMIFHGDALAIRNSGIDRFLGIKTPIEFMGMWETRKVICADKGLINSPPQSEIKTGFRYAIYGAGKRGKILFKKIMDAGSEVVCVVDGSLLKEGSEFCDMRVGLPTELIKFKDSIDCIAVATARYPYYPEIKEKIKNMGFREDQILRP